ncbi:MAG: PIN domain-containing protein [Planctomycetota bacterium]
MKVILDTNIVLDVLLERKPFVEAACAIFSLAERSEIDGLLCATTFTTIDYLLSQSLPARDARQAIWKLLSLFGVAIVNRPVIERALRSRITDFEDAVLDEAGQLAGAELIVTRNAKDFAGSPLKVLDPLEFLVHLKARGRQK